MTTTTFQVSTYQYYNFSSRSSGKTVIILKGTGGEICYIHFEDNPTAALPRAEQTSKKSYVFHYHHSQLQHLIDMLRNEKPITVIYDNDPVANNSIISTSAEPVGEGEEAGFE
ncbi:MAG: hypothetical protein WAW61_15965 [Methylococcaceae bacterium]